MQQGNNKKRPRGKPWPKGVSGNPQGRPPSVKFASEASREWFAAPSPEDPAKSNIQVVVEAIGGKAKKGCVASASWLADRAEGKAKQAIDITIEERRRELAERAIEALMVDAGVERDEAIEELAKLTPEIRTWIN